MVDIGYRVIRGPDWSWNDQDGGDGHVGTVVEVGHIGNSLSPDKTVIVQWDNGRRTNYRVGYKGAYDLLVFDGAPSGFKHDNKRCDGCGRRGIKGIRWQCTQCDDYDLCTRCYMDNVHNIQHKFRRFLTNRSTGVLIPKRAKCTRSQANGIYPGAKVMRGYDWVWGDQDGGKGTIGTVTDTRGWQNESDSSVARVMWPGDRPNVYRVGHRGKVDIKYVIPGKGPMYYKEHLPVLGKDVLDPSQIPPAKPCPFKIGDRVRVSLPIEVLKPMQRGHGGWNPKMADLIGKVGVVHRITQAGDIRVQYQNLYPGAHTASSSSPASSDSNRWTLNPAALALDREVEHFLVNDQVRVIDDYSLVKSLQSSEHGNWNEKMSEILGHAGVIVEVYRDGDVRVEFGQTTQWTFNPACLRHDPPRHRNGAAGGDIHAPPPLSSHGVGILELTDKRGTQVAADIIGKAAVGDLQGLKKLLHANPTMIDAQCKGKTALQAACFTGHSNVVHFLLRKKANLAVSDPTGDTALYYAMSGNKDDCVRLILEDATVADVSRVNGKKLSPLHVAVIKDNVEWARRILAIGCDVNLQDEVGDTAAHFCIINHNNVDMMRLLLSQTNLDPNKTNREGFNIVHVAARKGKLHALSAILEKFPDLARHAKTDGLTALHLSALNEHGAVTQLLVNKCPSLINQQDHKGQTALLFAASEGHPHIVDILVKAGARLDVATSDEKTCMDAALEKYMETYDAHEDNSSNFSSVETGSSHAATYSEQAVDISLPSSAEWDEVRDTLRRNGFGAFEGDVYLAISCFLLRIAAHQNADHTIGSDALDQVRDPRARAALLECRKQKCISSLPLEFSNQLHLTEHPSLKKLMSPTTTTSTNHSWNQRPSSSRISPSDELRKSFHYVHNNFVTQLEDDSECDDFCMSCTDEKASVVFRPCGHKPVCLECCVRMKKCIKCQRTITAKVDENGVDLSLPPPSMVSVLERKVRELQESNQCIICMERQRDTALRCGHRFCQNCAITLRKYCPICRKPITGTIRLY